MLTCATVFNYKLVYTLQISADTKSDALQHNVHNSLHFVILLDTAFNKNFALTCNEIDTSWMITFCPVQKNNSLTGWEANVCDRRTVCINGLRRNQK